MTILSAEQIKKLERLKTLMAKRVLLAKRIERMVKEQENIEKELEQVLKA